MYGWYLSISHLSTGNENTAPEDGHAAQRANLPGFHLELRHVVVKIHTPAFPDKRS